MINNALIRSRFSGSPLLQLLSTGVGVSVSLSIVVLSPLPQPRLNSS